MKAYRESRGIAPFIFNLRITWSSALNFTSMPFYSREVTMIPIYYEAGWAPETVSVFCREVKSLVPTRIRAPDRSSRSLVSIPTAVSLLHTIRYCGELCCILRWRPPLGLLLHAARPPNDLLRPRLDKLFRYHDRPPRLLTVRSSHPPGP